MLKCEVNFAKFVFARIFANFKYLAKKFILTESPDHVFINDINEMKFFRTPILEPLGSHFAKITHKVAKSKYFGKI